MNAAAVPGVEQVPQLLVAEPGCLLGSECLTSRRGGVSGKGLAVAGLGQ